MDDIEKLKIEYSNKRDKIKERLEQFEKFFNEPYSWFYRSNELVLLPVETKDDYRLFEELAFCIFTANTSAEMGLKAIDAVRNVLITGNANEMSRRLEGYRFPNVRASFIVDARNYLKNSIDFKIKDKIKSFNDSSELRNFFVKNIKGIGYKEASHFLRNIGFKGYAILDKHIMSSMYEFNVLNENIKLTPRNYFEIEQKFKNFSKEIGIDIDELDLLLWSRKNGRILK